MQTRRLVITLIALSFASLANAENIEMYYNPANAASSSGLTNGSELYRTIGCPGSGLLETTCAEEVKKAQVQVTEAVVSTPATTVEPISQPITVAEPAKTVTMSKQAAQTNVTTAPPSLGAKTFDECYNEFAKQAAENLRNTANFFNFAAIAQK